VTEQEAFEELINECIISLQSDVLMVESFINQDKNNPFYQDRIRLRNWIKESIEILKESL